MADPHEALAELRRTDPVHRQELDGHAGYWAVLKHADVVHVARHPDIYSASLGGVVLEDLPQESLEMMRHMLLAMDPPVHDLHRKPLAEHFKAKVIAGLEDQVRAICVDILRDVEAQGDIEFVHDVTSALPSRVIGRLMGLPEQDWSRIHDLAERTTSGEDTGASI